MDRLGLAEIDRFWKLENWCWIQKWQGIGTGLVLDWQNWIRLILDWSKEWPWMACDWHWIGRWLVRIDIWLSQIGRDCQELARGLANMYYWLGWKVDIGLALSWHRIGQDWHWLARTSHDWPELIMIGNARVPQIHPPSRLRAIPHRGLVLWLRT